MFPIDRYAEPAAILLGVTLVVYFLQAFIRAWLDIRRENRGC